jgi:hypothetical protein
VAVEKNEKMEGGVKREKVKGTAQGGSGWTLFHGGESEIWRRGLLGHEGRFPL